MPPPPATKLRTRRLKLLAATLGHLDAELESPARLAALLRAEVGPGWPPGEYDRNAQEFFRTCLDLGGVAVAGWYCWYAIRPGAEGKPATLIGAGGYFGPPDHKGVVEIGFSVLPNCRGRGFATEIAGALASNAMADPRVRLAIAHVAPENVASRRVLEKCEFHFAGQAPESGNLRFERLRAFEAGSYLVPPG